MEHEIKYKKWDKRFVLIKQLVIPKEVKLGQSKSETESYGRPSCCVLLKANFHFYTFLASKRLKIIYYPYRKHYNTKNTNCDFLFYFYSSIKWYESFQHYWIFYYWCCWKISRLQSVEPRDGRPAKAKRLIGIDTGLGPA